MHTEPFISLVLGFQLPSNIIPTHPPFTIKYNVINYCEILYPSATPKCMCILSSACLDDTVFLGRMLGNRVLRKFWGSDGEGGQEDLPAPWKPLLVSLQPP